VVLPADLGVSSSAARFVATYKRDREARADVIADALKLKLVSAGLLSIGLFMAAGPIADLYDAPALTWPLRGVAVSLVGESLLALLGMSFVAVGQVSANLRVIFFESALETVASITLVVLGAGATGAAFGRAIGYLFGAVLALVLTLRVFGRRALSLGPRTAGRMREIVGYAGALALVEGAWTIFAKIDSLLIGAFLSAQSVGLFAAPMRLVLFLSYPGYALALGVAPTLARPDAGRRQAATFATALRAMVLLQAALTVPLIVWSKPLTHLVLGRGYSESASVLLAVTPFMFLSGLAPLVTIAADYLGEARRRIPITLATLAINCIVVVLLIPRIGIVGAAIASDLAFALYVPAHLRICRRRIGLPLRPLALTLGRAAAAACVMAIILVALGTDSLSPVDWILGIVFGPAGFLATLIVAGELSGPELRAGWALVPGFLRRKERG
jgi:O-antigen/teichoic acid export membrane protein